MLRNDEDTFRVILVFANLGWLEEYWIPLPFVNSLETNMQGPRNLGSSFLDRVINTPEHNLQKSQLQKLPKEAEFSPMPLETGSQQLRQA